MNPLAQLGIALGIIILLCGISGYVGYEWKASKDQYVTESGYVKAQNTVIVKDGKQATNVNNTETDYEKQTNAAIDKFLHPVISVPDNSTRGSLPKAITTASGVDASTQKCRVNLQLCNIEVNEWQKYYTQQMGIINK